MVVTVINYIDIRNEIKKYKLTIRDNYLNIDYILNDYKYNIFYTVFNDKKYYIKVSKKEERIIKIKKIKTNKLQKISKFDKSKHTCYN